MKKIIRLLIEIDVNENKCGKCEGIKVICPNPMSFHFVCHFNNDAKIGINRDNLNRGQQCLDAEKESKNGS